MSLLNNVKSKVQEVSRKKKIDHFFELSKCNDKILDAGVYPELRHPDAPNSVNYFAKNFKYNPQNYVGLGIDDMTGMDKAYPGMKFIKYDGRIFPFKDKEFDWAFSNAVIEHVGDYDAQLLFLKESIRVSKNLFLTTPNKFFPIDSHTMVFFIHWNKNWFYNWLKKRNKWMPKDVLNLISKGTIKRLLKEANIKNYKIQSNRILGIPMTFTLIVNNN